MEPKAKGWVSSVVVWRVCRVLMSLCDSGRSKRIFSDRRVERD